MAGIMEFKCGICKAYFGFNPETIVLCNHKSIVHLGCCIDKCSWDHKPCRHAIGVYDRI